MEKNLQNLLTEVRELEKAVLEQIKGKKEELRYVVKNRTVLFQKEVLEKHKNVRKSVYRFLIETSFLSFLVAPVIYSMIIPALILDLFVSIFQAICFPVYRIPKVNRRDYIALDRGKLKYLNWIERVNCDYCGYFNGLIAYVREIATRTEQYFCPIRHALAVKGLNARQAKFLPYGEAENFRAKFNELRSEVQKISTDA